MFQHSVGKPLAPQSRMAMAIAHSLFLFATHLQQDATSKGTDPLELAKPACDVAKELFGRVVLGDAVELQQPGRWNVLQEKTDCAGWGRGSLSFESGVCLSEYPLLPSGLATHRPGHGHTRD